MTIAPGDNYEGQAIEGSVQFGETGTGSLQIAFNMELFGPDNKSVGQMTTFLYFTDAAAVYSYERLRALGWQGQGPDDIDKLGNIYSTRVKCRVTVPEQFKDPSTGAMKMGASKLEIQAGAGTVTLSKPLDMSTFKARLKAIGGGGGNATASSGGGGGQKPPF